MMNKYFSKKITPTENDSVEVLNNNQECKYEKEEIQYILYFDGCSKGNPGLGGAGAVLYKDGEEVWGSSKLVGEKVTNNVAEYTGLIMGLQEVFIRKIKNILVRGDSQLVIKQMKGEYKIKSSSLVEYYQQAKLLEKYFDKIVFEHVYRDKNKRADELSNMALQLL
jgi:ribonuclease HI